MYTVVNFAPVAVKKLMNNLFLGESSSPNITHVAFVWKWIKKFYGIYTDLLYKAWVEIPGSYYYLYRKWMFWKSLVLYWYRTYFVPKTYLVQVRESKVTATRYFDHDTVHALSWQFIHFSQSFFVREVPLKIDWVRKNPIYFIKLNSGFFF